MYISVGDEIIAVNQQKVSVEEIEQLIYHNLIGKTLDVTLLRKGLLLNTVIELVENIWVDIALV